MILTPEDLLADPTFLDFLQGKNTEHQRLWQEKIATTPALVPVVAQAKSLADGLCMGFAEEDTGSQVAAFKQTFQKNNGSQHTPVKPLFGWRYVAVAASIVAVLGIGFSVLKSYDGILSTEIAIAKHVQSLDNQKEITLNDGSKVILWPHSDLEISADFNQTQRVLRLTGRASFVVAKDAQKPFIVQTAKGNTQALGTAFWIEAYGFSPRVSVWLTEGQVKVWNKQQEKTLEPMQKAIFTTTGLEKSTFTSAETEQNLRFIDTPLTEVFERLENHYGVEIQLQNTIPANQRFSGNLNAEGLESNLEVIGVVNHFVTKHEVSGGKKIVTVRFRNE